MSIRDYKNLDFKNPRKQKIAKNKQKKIRKTIFFLSCFFLLSLFYFLFWSPYFRINEINIGGLNKIDKEKFSSIVNDYRNDRKYLIFSNNNLLFFSKEKLQEKIGKSYFLDNLEVYKDYPRYLEIWVTEKQANIVWLSGDQCLHLDENGVVIENCDSASRGIDLLRIKDKKNIYLNIADSAISEKELKLLSFIKESLKSSINTNLFEYNFDGPYAVRVETDQNYDLFFNLNSDINEQLKRFIILTSDEKIKSKLSEIDYIDLRFGDKIYYK